MKSVGEAMALGRTFKESLQKGLRSMEMGFSGMEDYVGDIDDDELKKGLMKFVPFRIFYVKEALKRGTSIDKIHDMSAIDKWFIHQIKQIVDFEKLIADGLELNKDNMMEAKQMGFSDKQIAKLVGKTELEIRKLRKDLGVNVVYKLVDTCAAEFEAYTPYYYSTYEQTDESIAAK